MRFSSSASNFLALHYRNFADQQNKSHLPESGLILICSRRYILSPISSLTEGINMSRDGLQGKIEYRENVSFSKGDRLCCAQHATIII